MAGTIRKGLLMAGKKVTIPKDEKPAARFKRVVEPRVGKAVKAIGLIGSVSKRVDIVLER